jgi:hypothetical protein
MSEHTLTGSLEIEEAFYVKGNGKSTSGYHTQHHDNAIADTPTAPAEPDGAEGKRIKQNGNISIRFMPFCFY